MAITGQSGDGTCEVHGCQLERLRNEVQRLTEVLTRIRNGGYHGASYIAGEALKSTEPKP